ncbi:MAG: ABC transporter permease [Propionibacteriaceae bacterium]
MNGFTSMLRKELTEFTRTWKIWVIPGLFIVLAVTGVLSARFTKELMQSLLPTSSDMSALFPDPTWRDTLVQWAKNLSQIGIVAILLMTGGTINAEGRQGIQILILTKPVSRWGYVLAKFVSSAMFCTATVTTGALVEYVASLFFFHDNQTLPLLQLTATWLLYALILIAVTLIGSAVLDSALAASGLGLAAMLALSLLGLWGPAAKYSPAGLAGIQSKIVSGEPVTSWWPIWTGLTAVAAFVALAGWLFSKREL